jgi:hypothetical protein
LYRVWDNVGLGWIPLDIFWIALDGVGDLWTDS